MTTIVPCACGSITDTSQCTGCHAWKCKSLACWGPPKRTGQLYKTCGKCLVKSRAYRTPTAHAMSDVKDSKILEQAAAALHHIGTAAAASSHSNQLPPPPVSQSDAKDDDDAQSRLAILFRCKIRLHGWLGACEMNLYDMSQYKPVADVEGKVLDRDRYVMTNFHASSKKVETIIAELRTSAIIQQVLGIWEVLLGPMDTPASSLLVTNKTETFFQRQTALERAKLQTNTLLAMINAEIELERLLESKQNLV